MDITILRRKESGSFTGELYATNGISEVPVALLSVRMSLSVNIPLGGSVHLDGIGLFICNIISVIGMIVDIFVCINKC